MNVLIAGGTGFVGSHLAQHFCELKASVTATGTSAAHPLSGRENFEYLSADTTREGAWQDRVQKAEVVINLAGRNIFKYWTKAYKKQIYDSRILTTRRLVEAMDENRPAVFLSTSAIGYYGDRGSEELGEEAPSGDDFLAKVCVDWEKEALRAAQKGIRVAIMRFGVVLGRGGALAKMIPAFKFFVGGPMASGRQWFPWMHIEDLTAAVDFLVGHDRLAGVFNFCSPQPVQNRDFAKGLGRALGRPAFMRVPEAAIRMFMGEMGGALLSSQRGLPRRLTAAGFQFAHPELAGALAGIVR